MSEPMGPIPARLEAVLFAAVEPVALGRLAAAAEVSPAVARRGLAELASHLEAHGHGVCLRELAGGFQLLTRAEHAEAVTAFVSPRQAPLSRAALESLAIIAFRQPVTRAAVDEIRGVHSEGAIGTLLERGFVAEGGRAEAPGRPFLYVTTNRFLEHFGLRSLEDLHRSEAAAALAALEGEAEARPRPLVPPPEDETAQESAR